MSEPPTSSADAIRVLIVDDDSVLVRSLQRVLSLQGFEVDTALDGRSALSQLERAAYDVMLLDLRMGSMDGMEVFAKAAPSGLPATIIHSAHIDVQTAVRATRAGVQDILQKPVPEELLGARIRELASERRARSPQSSSSSSKLEPSRDQAPLQRILGQSAPARALREQILRVADFHDVPVLVQGPTGTGKELVAQAVHALTCPREPFVSVNCAAVPEQLFESELFGHEAGAFTHARAARVGLFEEAGNGTLFLDEIGEMPLALQAKLLRVLETRQFRRVGGTRTHVFAARVVSATNRPLTSSLGGALRPDLFFRLAGYAIRAAPLVERIEDLPELATHFLAEFGARHDVLGLSFSPEALQALLAHDWPGNIRELRGVVENAAIATRSGLVSRLHVERAIQTRRQASGDDEALVEAPPELPAEAPTQASRVARSASGAVPTPLPAEDATKPVASEESTASGRRPSRRTSLPELQRELILQAFEQAHRNLSQTALTLGIPRSTLRARLRRYGVR